MKTKNQRLLRWNLTLQEHRVAVHHVKGRDNVVDNALSRIKSVIIIDGSVTSLMDRYP